MTSSDFQPKVGPRPLLWRPLQKKGVVCKIGPNYVICKKTCHDTQKHRFLEGRIVCDWELGKEIYNSFTFQKDRPTLLTPEC